jgi:BirA family biotin operon repressor/biotin-[acetyl-CoA-carboxylase] ligase
VISGQPIAWRLEFFDTLGSTSDLCIERAKAGAQAGLAVLALQQTAGRGSRGRQWQAPPGNLNFSVLLRPGLPAAQAGIFPLLAGIAVADAVCAFLPETAAPVLKWPNDVLLQGGKLAGILIDAAQLGQNLDWLVIGIGINLLHAPEIPGRRTATLKAHGGEATPEAAARILLHYLDEWLQRLQVSGPAAIVEAWQQRAHPLGTELAVQTAENSVTGRYAGLSPQGELLLNVEDCIERFSTGEVFLRVRG